MDKYVPVIKTLFSDTKRHPKILKNGLEKNVYSLILHLAPANRSGYEVCPMRSVGCTAACLNTAGFHHKNIDGSDKKETIRIARTKMFFEQREKFMDMIFNEIRRGKNYAEKRGHLFGVRLNGTSDIVWESVPVNGYMNLMEAYPDVPFYDYTKRWNRKDLPKNYKLTFSRSENNHHKCVHALNNGMNVAIVYDVGKKEPFPKGHIFGGKSYPIIDGDLNDWRYGDYEENSTPVIIGLRPKGMAKKDTTGFVFRFAKEESLAA